MTASAHLLSQRLADVADVHMRDLLVAAPALRQLSPDFVGILLTHARELQIELESAASREALVGVLSDGMAVWMTREHQFVELEHRDRDVLSAHYRRLVHDIAMSLAEHDACERIETALATHHARLQVWLTTLLEDAGASEAMKFGAQIVCAEYSPVMQLRILGLDEQRLAEPIIDLGCGETGLLVRHLRSNGQTQVFGIDQNAQRADWLIRSSWFDFPLTESSLGTIVAHQSFSLHFLHAHIASEQRATKFARRYMSLLGALREGGRFAYAPGLPFMERLLDRQIFDVAHRPISLPYGREAPPGLLAALDGQPLGSTIITRQKR